jgi:hypothetical protein
MVSSWFEQEVVMKRNVFDAMTFEEVSERAAAEPAAEAGKPEYFERPWSQLRDEMTTESAKTVGDLPELRGDVFYHSTGSVYGDPFKLLSNQTEPPSTT